MNKPPVGLTAIKNIRIHERQLLCREIGYIIMRGLK